MPASVVQVEGLTKRYGALTAVRDLSFEVYEGEIFGFLGPNGAGKTTTIRLLTGLAKPTAGRMRILSHEVPRFYASVVSRVAAIVEGPSFYRHLSAVDNLKVLAHTAEWRVPQNRLEGVLEEVGLGDAASKRAGTFSTGMLQRLGLAWCLLCEPDLLILDEPTSGLDPHGVRAVREILRKLAADGRTIVLSSHQLLEVELLCARALVIDRGERVRYGALDDMLSHLGQMVLRVADLEAASKILRRNRITHQREGDALLVPSGAGARVLKVLAEANIFPTEFSAPKLSLEDLFMEATART